MPFLGSNFFNARLRRSLTLKTMAWLGFPIVGISSLAIVAVYFYTLHEAELQIRQALYRHLQDRSRQDSEIFQLAQANHQILKQDLLERLAQPIAANSASDINQRFQKMVYPWRDGTLRNFPQQQNFKTFPAQQKPTIFIGPKVPLTTEEKAHVLIFEDLTAQYGRAFQSRFNNTWINSRQNISVDYRPDTLWGLEAAASTDITQEEYGKIATQAENPTRSPRWTSLYFDPVPARWMVSLVTPVDVQGNHVATIGNDIILNELIEVTLRDRFPKSRNVIFQSNGQLIVHTDRMEEIKTTGGKLNLQSINDPELQRIFQTISQDQENAQQLSQSKDSIHIIKDPQNQSFWAITQIKGPDWYWVTLYPQAELRKQAIEQTLPLIIFGILGLFTELYLIYRVLRRNVHQPLAKLSTATAAIAKGRFEVELPTDRPDELGRLANSFSSMAAQLQTSFSKLATYNETLEAQVQERTQELSNTLNNLQKAQAQLIQSEKMSSLGQMVAGIAHEVNNPIGFVHGNLQYANTYITHLLDHIEYYQKYHPTPEIVQTHAQAIDLDFIQTDLPKLLNSMQIGTERIQEIVLSLRNFSRIDGIELKKANLHDGLDSTLLILNHRLKRPPKKPIVLEKNYGDLPEFLCYPGLLNQVFMNLISNAIDALESIEDAKIIITSRPVEGEVEVIITDNGHGIPESLISEIFHPFFTTKEEGKGTGLGLSISHQIITDRHKGKIRCRSSSLGTLFIIRLPLTMQIPDLNSPDSNNPDQDP